MLASNLWCPNFNEVSTLQVSIEWNFEPIGGKMFNSGKSESENILFILLWHLVARKHLVMCKLQWGLHPVGFNEVRLEILKGKMFNLSRNNCRKWKWKHLIHSDVTLGCLQTSMRFASHRLQWSEIGAIRGASPNFNQLLIQGRHNLQGYFKLVLHLLRSPGFQGHQNCRVNIEILEHVYISTVTVQ